MDIKKFFSRRSTDNPKDILRTAYGDFNLAKESDREQVQRMVIDLQRTTDVLTRKDIKNWREKIEKIKMEIE